MAKKSKQPRSSKILIIVLFAFFIVSVLVTVYFILSSNVAIRQLFLKESDGANTYKGSYLITEPPPTTNPAPKPTYPEVANIQDMKWIPYEATCAGLKENVTVYYPELWKLGHDGETSVTDSQNNNSECMINFGYPFSPGFSQNPYVDGLHGYIEIVSLLAPGRQLRDIQDEYNQNRTVKDAHITTVANREWVTYNQGGKGDFFNQIVLRTIYKNREYIVRYGTVDSGNISDSQNQLLFAVGEEFISKLQFH